MDLALSVRQERTTARLISVRSGARQIAVRLCGDFDDALKVPIICISGYQRNMSDFFAFADKFSEFSEKNWPILRVDLLGRGLASHALKTEDYSTLDDASDMVEMCRALGIHKAIWFGQSHGGQVIMALGAKVPTLIGAAILCDTGALISAQGLVRLRNNLKFLAKVRKQEDAMQAIRQILSADYPSLGTGKLDSIGGRTHQWNKRRKHLEPQFDWRLLERLDAFDNDDVLNSNWEMFDSLNQVPLLMMRTQNTDLLRADVYQRMLTRRPDAISLEIVGEGSPALLENAEEMGAIAEFIMHSNKGIIKA
ncbi:alpha/beta fold hydrolase [Maritalea sp.]|jgi:pimeloyl-ACP methyl ester carboxylesterase|uniref:alpha/beta hydrolase n=1 Tax=Maritalea sp. TaxID=2003361 RepID=UPI0039E71F25